MSKVFSALSKSLFMMAFLFAGKSFVAAQVFEAENLSPAASSAGFTVVANAPGASNNSYVQFTGAPVAGDWLEFTVNGVTAGTYNIRMYFKSNNNRSICQGSVDGTNLGGPCDEYQATATQQVLFNMGNRALAAGSHKIRFTVTGKNPSSAGFTMTVDKFEFASVSQNYTLTVNNDGHGTTNPSGAATVTDNVPFSISATQANGYVFSIWTVSSGTATFANANASSTTVTVSGGNATIQANFTLSTFTLSTSVAPSGAGSVTAPVSLSYNVPAAIQAVPSTGYDFNGWSVTAGTATIADPSNSNTTITATAGPVSLVANFAVKTFPLTVIINPTGAGAVTVPSSLTYGVSAALSASPAAGYDFAGWSINAGTATIADASNRNTTITATAGPVSLVANFAVKTFPLTVIINPTGAGTITAPSSVTYGLPAAIQAAPAAGYNFSGWSVTAGTATIADPLNPNTTIAATAGPVSIVATFALKTYTLTVTSDGNGATVPAGSVSVQHNVATDISATPNSGFNFSAWVVTAGSATIANSASSTTQVTLSSGNATIQATFTSASSGTPTSRQISISGTLTDVSGNPIGNSSPVVVDATVRLYTDKTSGTEVYRETFWTAQEQGVTVDKGMFVARLGTGTTSYNLRSVLSAIQNLFVEITIEGATPDVLLPRTSLTASPYSLIHVTAP